MKYTGTLAKPVVRKAHRLLLAERLKGESTLFDQPYMERVEKIPALFEAYSIPFGDWKRLAFLLAVEHVPGFKIVNPAGRKTEWNKFWKAEFRLTVDGLREANPGMKITDAIRRVCRLSSWVEKTKGMKVPALSKHYYGADTETVEYMQSVGAYESTVGHK